MIIWSHYFLCSWVPSLLHPVETGVPLAPTVCCWCYYWKTAFAMPALYPFSVYHVLQLITHVSFTFEACLDKSIPDVNCNRLRAPLERGIEKKCWNMHMQNRWMKNTRILYECVLGWTAEKHRKPKHEVYEWMFFFPYETKHKGKFPMFFLETIPVIQRTLQWQNP